MVLPSEFQSQIANAANPRSINKASKIEIIASDYPQGSSSGCAQIPDVDGGTLAIAGFGLLVIEI